MDRAYGGSVPRRDSDGETSGSAPAAGDIADATRGTLKIFFGYAAGVGKTYAMLERAHAAVGEGCDVVVGYIEPHTRVETMALVEGLECVSPLAVEHRGITLRELDLDAVLARNPQIVLVDELAHTNASGRRHRKRYQDVEELLRAGISVFTTMNVQHLEGLNDKIAAITQVDVTERVPDRVFDCADSVELVDIEPNDLIERLEAGKVYLPERAAAALANFFSRRNLMALREIALRRMADRLTRRAEDRGPTTHGEAGEDVLVRVTAEAGNAKVIRAAANMAESLHGTLTALVVVAESRRPATDESVRLRRNIDLAEELGGHVVTLHGDDAALLISQYSVTAGITHLVIGGAASGAGPVWARDEIVNRLIRLSYGASITVIPVKDLPGRLGAARGVTGFRLTWGDFGKALAAVAVATAFGLALHSLGFASSVILMIYMLVTLLFATRAEGFFYAVFAALGSVLAYNFFLTEPRFTFHVAGFSYPIIFAFLLVGTLVASSLAIRIKRQAEATARRAYRTEVLLESSRELQASTTVEACFATSATQLMKILDRPVIMYRMGDDGRLGEPQVSDPSGAGALPAGLTAQSEMAVAAWVASNNERAGATTDTLREARCLYLPIRSKNQVFGVAGLMVQNDDEDFGAFEKNLMVAVLAECGQAAERLSFARERHEMRMKVEKEALRSNLLRAISHDLRTPLTSISGDADMLLSASGHLTEKQRLQMYRDIHEDASWLIDLVENLLSVTRIDDGTVQLTLQPELIGDVVQEALRHAGRRLEDHHVSVEVPDELLLAQMDARLIMQVIVNLVNNAATYTPRGSNITVSALRADDGCRPVVRVSVADDGPGVPDADKARIFDMFAHASVADRLVEGGDARRGMGLGLALCRSIVRVHGGEITVRDACPHGCVFSFDVPLVHVDGLEEWNERGASWQGER